MPFTLPSRTPSGPRRRTLLASAAGAFALAGCSTSEPSTTETSGGGPSAADRARARAARDSRALAERYAAVITAYPSLAERLRPLRAEVVRHTAAFDSGSRASGSPSPSASASESAVAAGATPAPSATVPATEKDALKELASAERTLADQRAKALLDVPGELARLLASVAAAGAAHAYLLTEGTK
ncbi:MULTISPECIES: hypothetical protein [unclassified Streptomyces]|uniref:hypothetical protein n=1 Tax=unclassified Streptomyces TaxID=2593676 RepID=UPI002256213B|nr:MULTISPECIES: hypothetical protein [unclassified Streptomyces]MCX4979280.1 hypothetical protein [Streptomyces sp. NBC_00620]